MQQHLQDNFLCNKGLVAEVYRKVTDSNDSWNEMLITVKDGKSLQGDYEAA
jgi:hypothetical protein